jgi:hypothetical protein
MSTRTKKYTKEEFIEKSIAIHDDKYNYSKTEYVNGSTKVIIICPEHGDFLQTPKNHSTGSGCTRCSIDNKTFNTEDFIKKAIVVHGDRYDYSLVKCLGTRISVIIICKEHGEFLQTPNNHFANSGCLICSGTLQLTTDDFIKRSIVVHGDKYDYSKVNYIANSKKIIIICKEHGEFLQTPNNHLKGQTCRKCDNTRKSSNTIDFINSANKIHNNFYRYDLVNYINTHTKVTIICPEHKEFLQTPGHHLNGRGCPSCAISGFSQNKPGYCYYIKFESENNPTLYKIGITNLSVNKRLKTIKPYKEYIPTILQELYFENGSDSLNMETKILRDFKEFKYIGEPIMQNGNTELFTKDILNLDN